MALSKDSTSPTISISLAIDPPTISLNHPQRTHSILLTATLQAPSPITIFAWPNIFNLKLAQRRGNFICLDLTTNTLLRIDTVKVKRYPFHRDKDGADDPYFHTLEPEVPVAFSYKFGLAYPGRDILAPGHRYRFSVRGGERVEWWRYGTRDEVMSPPGERVCLGEASGEAISLEEAAVEFAVE